jgi:hypothetical protein
MPRKVSLSGIVMATIFAVSVVVTLTGFGIFDNNAQGQGNLTKGNVTIGNVTLTPEQVAAICNPNNPKLKVVNTTESKICGIPVTIKPRTNMTTPANTTASANTTTGTEAPSVVPTP